MTASANRTGRLAGGLYLLLLPFGIFSFAYVPSVILAPGDAVATARNLLASEALFRVGVLSHLVSQVIVVFLALAMYRLFRAVNPHRAALMVILALLCVALSFSAEVDSLAALRAAGSADVGGFAAEPSPAAAVELLRQQRDGVLLAQVFWALWMLPLAALVFRSGFLPRLLAIPVWIAAAGYLLDSVLHVLSPGGPMIGPFTALAELVLPLWLVIRGVRRGPAPG